jgi:hypothetical protein
MATNTYVALRTETVTGSAASSITFSLSGISGYTDLVIVGQYGSTVTEDYLRMQFNSDTTTNYSATRIDGNGSSARSTKTANQNYVTLDWNSSCENALTKMTRVNIMNYANTTTFKTVLVRGDRATATTPTYTGTEAIVGLWRKTPEAITSIVLTMQTGNILVGSTFSLYGIKAWSPEVTPKATGGYVYEDSTYWYHAFPFSSTFVPNQSLTADILQVAGGGGAGTYRSGGGGAGGLLAFTSQSLSATGYSVTVGAGGAGGTSSTGTNGVNSQFASLTASVGGGGGGSGNGPGTGANGGSGGGGTGFYGDKAGGSASPSGQGNAGGTGSDAYPYPSGGGGGAGAAGGTYSGSIAGNGGIGVTSSFINAIGAATTYGEFSSGNYYFAGGGGGGVYVTEGTPGTGGKGGGGAGAQANATITVPGIASTGGGGGGSASATAGGSDRGGNGGSGFVVVRYAK